MGAGAAAAQQQGAGITVGGCLRGAAGWAPQRCKVCPKCYAPKWSCGDINHSACGVSKRNVSVGVNGS